MPRKHRRPDATPPRPQPLTKANITARRWRSRPLPGFVLDAFAAVRQLAVIAEREGWLDNLWVRDWVDVMW